MAREITVLSVGDSGRASVLMYFPLSMLYETPDGMPIRPQAVADLDSKISDLALLTIDQLDKIELGHAVVEIQPVTLDEDELKDITKAYRKIRTVYNKRAERIPEEHRRRYQFVGHQVPREDD